MRVAGFGFRAGATVESLADALARAGGGVALIATAQAKARAPAFCALAGRLGVPAVGIGPERLARERTPSHSPRVAGLFGTGSLAEAAALAAAGPGARLLGPRVVSADGMATAAIAEGMTT